MLTLFRSNSIPNKNTKVQTLEEALPFGTNALEASSARSAISLLLKKLSRSDRRGVAIPGYTAEGLVQAIKWASLKPYFYEQTANLLISEYRLRACLSANNDVSTCIVVHPFGILQEISRVKKICAEFGVNVVEDFAQCPMFGKEFDRSARGIAAIYSFNKWLPISDGAVVTGDTRKLVFNETLPELNPRRRLSNKYFSKHLDYNRQLNATSDLKKARILLHATAREYGRYYEIQSTEIRACAPDYSFSKIQESFDIFQVVRRRRENAIRLCDGLRAVGIEVVYETPSFKTGFPIAVPVRLRNQKERNHFLDGLFKHGIIGHVQTDKWQFFCMSSNMHKGEKEFVAKHLLLPINENYEFEHMDHIATAMEKISKGV